jgi:hypothetical protein
MFDRDIWKRILQEAREPQFVSIELALCCRLFREIVYEINGGPIDKPQGPYSKSLDLIAVRKSQFRQQLYFLDRLWLNDYKFVQHCIDQYPEFVNSALFAFTGVRAPANLYELIYRGQRTAFNLIVRNLEMPFFSQEGVIHNLGTLAQGHSYQYYREIFLHNVKYGYHLERSGCISCRQRPRFHRGETLKAILINDDIELFRLYVSQRYKYKENASEGYPLPQRILFFMACVSAKKIIEYVLHSGILKPEMLLVHMKRLVFENRDILVLVANGVDFSSIQILRYAIKHNHSCATLLWNTYKYKLTAQDRQHFIHNNALASQLINS